MQRILIVRLSAIGDVALATSLLPPLRRAYPDAQIMWLTENMGAEILGGNPMIDRVLLVPRKRWKQLWKERRYREVLAEFRALVKDLRAFRADVALDAQGLMRSGFWTRIAGAKRRIGLGSKEGSQFLMHEVVDAERETPGRLCHDYRLMLEHLGVPTDPFALGLHVPAEYADEAREAIPDPAAGPVFFYPFTTRPQKHWFDDRWAELARKVVTEMGREVWILGGPANEADANTIAKAAGVEGVRVIAGPASNLRQKMALIERGSGAVGVDTGLSHISIGQETPTVVLFGSTCVYNDCRPLPGRILYHKLPCSPCHRHPTCEGRFDCMRALTVEQVFAALQAEMALAAGSEKTAHSRSDSRK